MVQICTEIFSEEILLWILKYPVIVIVRETELDRSTASKILLLLRSLIFHCYLENNQMIGGSGYVV